MTFVDASSPFQFISDIKIQRINPNIKISLECGFKSWSYQYFILSLQSKLLKHQNHNIEMSVWSKPIKLVWIIFTKCKKLHKM